MQRLQWQGDQAVKNAVWDSGGVTLHNSSEAILPKNNNPRWRPGRRIFCGMSLGWSAVGTWQVKDKGIEMGDSVIVMISPNWKQVKQVPFLKWFHVVSCGVTVSPLAWGKGPTKHVVQFHGFSKLPNMSVWSPAFVKPGRSTRVRSITVGEKIRKRIGSALTPEFNVVTSVWNKKQNSWSYCHFYN